MKLEINDDLADEIMRQVLRQQYESLCHSIKILENRLNLPFYEETDLKDNIMYARAIRTTLEYFTEHADHQRWLQSVEDELND